MQKGSKLVLKAGEWEHFPSPCVPSTETPPQCPALGLLGSLPLCVKHKGLSSMLLCLNLPRGLYALEDPHLPRPTPSSLQKLPPNAAQPFPLHLPLLLPAVTYLGSHFASGPLQAACVGLFVNNLSRNIRVWGKNMELFTQAARASEAAGAGGQLCPGRLAGPWRPEEEGRGHQESLEPPGGDGRGHWGTAESLEHAWQCGHVPLCKVFPFLLGCRERDADLLPIQSKSAENNGGFCCCCCFLFLPLKFFFLVTYPRHWNVLMRKSWLQEGQEMKSRADFKNNAQFYCAANSQRVFEMKGKEKLHSI